MFRLSGLLCLLVAVVSGALLFQTSQSVQRAEHELSQVQSDIGMENESLRILTAEWDYLNRPERLEKLTLQNLDMDESLAEKASFVGGGVPEPRVPVLPQVKPKNILRYVSTQNGGAEDAVVSETIQNAEGQRFEQLIDTTGDE